MYEYCVLTQSGEQTYFTGYGARQAGFINVQAFQSISLGIRGYFELTCEPSRD
jgi:hypothetical protein